MRIHFRNDTRLLAAVALIAYAACQRIGSLWLGSEAWPGFGEGGLLLLWAIGISDDDLVAGGAPRLHRSPQRCATATVIEQQHGA